MPETKKHPGDCPYCKIALKDLITEALEAKKQADAHEPVLEAQRQTYRDKGETVPPLKNPYRLEQKDLDARVEQMKKSHLLDEGGRKIQCQGCGKHWDKEAIGKPYTLDLERGMAYIEEKGKKAAKSE